MQVTIRGTPFIYRLVFTQKLSSRADRWWLPKTWGCEHGRLVFVLGNHSSAGKHPRLLVDSEQSWGALGVERLENMSRGFFNPLPEGIPPLALSTLTLQRVSSTKIVRERLGSLLHDLESDDILFEHIESARSGISRELRRWRRKTISAVKRCFGTYQQDSADQFHRSLMTVAPFL